MKNRTYKKITLLIAAILLIETIVPPRTFALTGGPAQPEFSSFEPVSTTDMVGEFTGDFTYNLPILNIPGGNGGGYALSLSYHSGETPEQEASWVGYGWTVNPGAIIRNKRGFPDDWNGVDVTYWNKMPPNETVTIGEGINAEIFSIDNFDVGLGVNASTRYNNYKGYGYSYGAGLPLWKGVISLGFNVTDGEISYSASINPAGILTNLLSNNNQGGRERDTRKDISDVSRILARNQAHYTKKNQFQSGSLYNMFSFPDTNYPTQITKYKGESYNFSIGLLATVSPIQAGPSANIFGSYSKQTNDSPDTLKAYGYMYSHKATDTDTSIMDYYIEKGSTYNKSDTFLGIPFNNADNFSVTGEGIGGGFRMYSKKAGHYRPNSKTSTTAIYNIGGEIEAGLNWGAGLDLGIGNQTLEVGEWKKLTDFADEGDVSEDEPNFFRFNNDLGGYVLFGTVEPEKANISIFDDPSISHITNTINGGERVGRSSYIGYHVNKEIGSGSVHYREYSKEDFKEYIVRGEDAIKDQIGEISIVNENGQRYTFGLPVYSRNEKNLQFGLAGTPPNSYVVYNDNIYKEGKENEIIDEAKVDTIIGEERAAPYASMYLLTSITDTDYIDRTNNGPTDDDFGGYTRFVYSRAYGSTSKSDLSTGDSWYKWRIPYTGFIYERNELSDQKDDLGSVVEGEKEVYYLKEIVTKTHIAKFITSERRDGMDASHSAKDAGRDSTAKGTNKLRKLDKIELYAKRDGYEKLIKTVHFEYDYSLCSNIVNNSGVPEIVRGQDI